MLRILSSNEACEHAVGFSLDIKIEDWSELHLITNEYNLSGILKGEKGFDLLRLSSLVNHDTSELKRSDLVHEACLACSYDDLGLAQYLLLHLPLEFKKTLVSGAAKRGNTRILKVLLDTH